MTTASLTVRERLLSALYGSPELRPGEANQLLADHDADTIALRVRVTELEAELKKYVGVEPTIAEEMAYLSRCLDAVIGVCDAAERQATRWEHPLPVPEWVATVRNAVDGVLAPATTTPTTLRWDRTVMPPDGQDPHTIVCCTDTDTGRSVALFLDPIERTRLALRLADPGDASGQAARREVLRQVVTAEGGRWKSSRARRLLAEHGYAITPRTARNDLAALCAEGLLVAHDEPGIRYYTPKGDR
ncbi:hypothetical protein ACFYUJ_21030 [Streptomyces sp. NPDC004520]|uniref:hypothetical protein n=1 Tax=Streptomyces sp. NPDC004520 TaxID=3364702 RepID=UPI00368ACB98